MTSNSSGALASSVESPGYDSDGRSSVLESATRPNADIDISETPEPPRVQPKEKIGTLYQKSESINTHDWALIKVDFNALLSMHLVGGQFGGKHSTTDMKSAIGSKFLLITST